MLAQGAEASLSIDGEVRIRTSQILPKGTKCAFVSTVKFLLFGWEGLESQCPQSGPLPVTVLCKLRSGHLENRAFHERAYPRSGGKRFPLLFQTLRLGKLLWEGRYYNYPQMLCVGDVCSVKTKVGLC